MPGGRPRGGRRNGAARKAYANRSDLNGGPKPISVAPGQGYGEAKAQTDAQRAVPMGTPPVAPAAAPGEYPPDMPRPGQVTSLFADSTNPDEHVMSGAALGPGPGPEAFGYGEQAQTASDLAYAGQYLPAMELAANGPKGSDSARQIVRLLKARMNGPIERRG
jgi:hypothetical protein